MSSPGSVLCFGEAMVEVSLDTAQPDTARIGFAGDTLNTAIYLKRVAPALEVAYGSKVGRDRLSDDMVAFIESEGIDTRFVQRSPDAMPGLYAISTDAAGERSFMYWRSTSAARQVLDPPALPLSDLTGFGLFYYSAISLAILPPARREELMSWLGDYRAGGGLVAFDSNYRPALWPDRNTARRVVSEAWRQTDIALPSLDDEWALFGDRTEEATQERLFGYGIRSGALKRGALGPVALDGTPCEGFAPADKVVDSTAAGDSFNGGYLAGRIGGKDECACLHAGHDLARRVVGSRGAILPGSKALSG